MTDLLFNTGLTLQATLAPQTAPNRAVEGQAIQLSPGVLGTFVNPLVANAFAFAVLPMLLAMRGGTMQQPEQASAAPEFAPTPGAEWTATLQGQGTADVDLGDGYTLQLDENNSQMVIHDANTGETTKIWGDPHVEVNGEHKFDFWGTTTFTLGNGTKITINTEQYAANPSMYVANAVTITKGDQALQINGLSQNTLGDLSVSLSHDGYALDAATRDGYVLDQTATGWTSELTGQQATQADLDMTRPGQLYGPDSEMPSLGEVSQALSTFLFFGVVAGFEAGAQRVAQSAALRAAFA
ncbi:DUF1521 domain-containing protein [Sphingomonas sp. H39-1-10]|uniref:DUF1521 domain-containing protein n=1 Tax=Sphingomonas pollutisoli TaxID=3030829 RepID=UPI0023B8C44C|nr:DUF1521 domain-containing protein [Sphingomonas pollutisoli]MDF0489990.1 DUF1521 domain-containing protein [Sphingomonas pollutisoli]